MESLNVRSNERPKTVEVFPTKDCFMRKNIVDVEDEDGKHFEYDEVFFISDATEEEIESDFDTFYETAKDWQPPVISPTPTWQERMEAQVTLTALLTKTRI